MRKPAKTLLATVLTAAAFGVTIATATAASACTGDVCDSFCYLYADLPPSVQQKVFHSQYCPIL